MLLAIDDYSAERWTQRWSWKFGPGVKNRMTQEVVQNEEKKNYSSELKAKVVLEASREAMWTCRGLMPLI
ncbi:MAG: hypothetical protein ACSHXW_17610 [Yoonia sp.]